MSHFTVHVLCPKDTADIEAKIEELLAPYNENTRVPEYETDCYCQTHNFSVARNEAVEKKFGNFDKCYRQTFKKIVEEKGAEWNEDERQKQWEAHIAPYTDYQDSLEKDEAFVKQHTKPDPECTDCKGTGKEMTTYNPKSKWDWYSIGGRWYGSLTAQPYREREMFKDYPQGAALRENSILVSERLKQKPAYIKETMPYAIITPDGVWHEKGKMLMFGMSKDEKDSDAWEANVLEAYKQNADCIAVLVDCHI